MKRILILFAALTFLLLNAGAQTVVLPGGRKDMKKSGTIVKQDVLKPGGNTSNPGVLTLPVEMGGQDQQQLDRLQKQMEERDWASEDSAWQRANSTGTREAYQTYIARFPNGAHRPQANQKLVDMSVNDIFSQDHNKMPEIDRVRADETSPTSTITVENDTQFILTVYYSGAESRTVNIFPGQKSTVTLKNGSYRIAASVPPAGIKPFAGSQSFTGGDYEVGFVIAPERRVR